MTEDAEAWLHLRPTCAQCGGPRLRGDLFSQSVPCVRFCGEACLKAHEDARKFICRQCGARIHVGPDYYAPDGSYLCSPACARAVVTVYGADAWNRSG